MGTCGSANDNKQKTSQNKLVNSAKLDSKPQVTEPKQIKVTVIDKNDRTKQIVNQEFNDNITLEEVFSSVKYNKNFEFILEDSSGEKLNDKLSEKLKNIFNKNEVELTVQVCGFDIPLNVSEEYRRSTLISSVSIGFTEYFQYVIFDTSNSQLTTHQYIPEKGSLLEVFNRFSASCSGENKLFLSGGELPQEDPSQPPKLLNNFISLDLSGSDRKFLSSNKLPDLLEKRTWHSMIYIPNKYVFIVGGVGTKSMEVYDTEKNSIELVSELNEERAEPSLILVDSCFLYAVCGFLINQSFVNSIERCNLRTEKKKWEMVNYTLDNGINFNISFFGIGYGNDNSIILIGEKGGEEESYSYKLTTDNEHKICSFNTPSFQQPIAFKDKFFYPLDEDESINLPFVSSEVQTLTLNKKTEKLTVNSYPQIVPTEFQ